MIRYGDLLSTSGLQLSYKPKHSTTMCSLTLTEVVNYYRKRDSNIYAVFIDASQALGRVKYNQHFSILIKKGIPAIIVRIIMDMYENQESHVTWNGTYGDYLKCSNGVRQGGVASPVLFTIYMDELTTRLEKSGIGCFIEHQYYGCISYADDLVLLCPSVKGLQKIVAICEKYGIMYNITYNANKSMCLAFDRTMTQVETIMIAFLFPKGKQVGVCQMC